jgi:hypothetical protein
MPVRPCGRVDERERTGAEREGDVDRGQRLQRTAARPARDHEVVEAVEQQQRPEEQQRPS